jgi:hypothetical protein
VPAAAVIRGLRTLSGIIGRKEMRRRFIKSVVKSYGLTIESLRKLVKLRKAEEDGILRVLVKWVDTERNINGEGSLLGFF